MEHSAGILLYRDTQNGLEVLLVHPSGNYNRSAPWSIPKGLSEPGESLESTARRELNEETGLVAGDELVALSYIDYSSGRKRVHGFAAPSPPNAKPHCASWEVDHAEFVSVDEARNRLHHDQLLFLDRLQAKLGPGE